MKKEILGDVLMTVGVLVQVYFTSWMLIGVVECNTALTRREESAEEDIPMLVLVRNPAYLTIRSVHHGSSVVH